jgi:hypothetical protein
MTLVLKPITNTQDEHSQPKYQREQRVMIMNNFLEDRLHEAVHKENKRFKGPLLSATRSLISHIFV